MGHVPFILAGLAAFGAVYLGTIWLVHRFAPSRAEVHRAPRPDREPQTLSLPRRLARKLPRSIRRAFVRGWDRHGPKGHKPGRHHAGRAAQ